MLKESRPGETILKVNFKDYWYRGTKMAQPGRCMHAYQLIVRFGISGETGFAIFSIHTHKILHTYIRSQFTRGNFQINWKNRSDQDINDEKDVNKTTQNKNIEWTVFIWKNHMWRWWLIRLTIFYGRMNLLIEFVRWNKNRRWIRAKLPFISRCKIKLNW